VLNFALAGAVVITGTLAPADPGVLEDVQSRRIRYGWGLDGPAPDGAVLVAVDDCNLVGYRGVVCVEAGACYAAAVVDCCAVAGCLAGKGLAADVSDARLGHQKATVYLWQNEKH